MLKKLKPFKELSSQWHGGFGTQLYMMNCTDGPNDLAELMREIELCLIESETDDFISFRRAVRAEIRLADLTEGLKYKVGDIVVLNRAMIQTMGLVTYPVEYEYLVRIGCEVLGFHASLSCAILADPHSPGNTGIELDTGTTRINVKGLVRKKTRYLDDPN